MLVNNGDTVIHHRDSGLHGSKRLKDPGKNESADYPQDLSNKKSLGVSMPSRNHQATRISLFVENMKSSSGFVHAFFVTSLDYNRLINQMSITVINCMQHMQLRPHPA